MRLGTVGMVLAAVTGLAVSTTASASVVVPLDEFFSNSTSPQGAGPWLTATFSNHGTLGDTVVLSLQANLGSSSAGADFLHNFYFNLDPSLNPTSLVVNQNSGPSAEKINRGANKYRADGDGYFDVRVDWAANDFSGTDLVEFHLSGIAGLDESWFNHFSAPGPGPGNPGPFVVAAQVGGIPYGDGSTFIGGDHPLTPPPPPPIIPLPSAAGLALAGVFLVGGVRRRRS